MLEGDWDFACHIANCYTTFGSGIAYFIRRKFPKVYQADLDCDLNEVDKLGNYSYGDIGDGRGIYNIYAMRGLGNDGSHLGRNCSYDALADALDKICEEIEYNCSLWEGRIRVGVPRLMGCCRAGGSWTIVESILQTMEELHPNIEFVVYDFEGEEKAQSTLPIKH